MREALCWLFLGRRAIAVLASCSIAIVLWPTKPAPSPAPEVTYRYVPLLGQPLDFAIDEADGELEDANVVRPSSLARGGCLPFLQTVVERAGWQLQFVAASSGCLGEMLHDHYVVDAFGGVTWTRRHVPARQLALLPEELARVQKLDRLDCVRTEPVGYGEAFYRVALVGIPNAEGGAHISGSSTMAAELEAILEAAKVRYRAQRLAALGPMSLRLGMSPSLGDDRVYQLDLEGTQVTIRRRTKILHAQVLEPADLVEVLDRLVAPGPDDDTYDRGWLRTGGETRAVALPKYHGDLGNPVQRAVDEAAYHEHPMRQESVALINRAMGSK